MKVMDCRYRPTTAAWMDTFVKNPVYAEYVKITGFDRKPVKDLDACVAQLTGRMICSAERRSRSLPFIVRLRRYRLVFGARSTRPRLTGAVRFSCGVTAGKPPASSSASSSMSLLARVFP